MRSDRDHLGKTPHRNSPVPVPGMPYRFHTDTKDDAAPAHSRDFEFIESKPVRAENAAEESAYNPWEEMGWQGGEAPFSVTQEPEALQEEQYFKPMLDLSREMPPAYDAYSGTDETETYAQEPVYPEYVSDEPIFEEAPPPIPVEPSPKKSREPWRVAVVMFCIAGLIFCGVEIYRIAKDITDSEAALREYREIYITENNEDFFKSAQAVALRPAEETYPPTATPVPVSTPTPTPRIEQNDPLIAVMADSTDAQQTDTPASQTQTTARYTLERYPENPLLEIREYIATQQVTNEDIVGHLVIDGLLDELVVMRNNTYYLNHKANGDYSGYGAVFVDENTVFRYPPENIVLYGRTSYEGKVFEPLKNYVQQGLDFAARYAFLTFESVYEEARYVIFAVIESSNDPTAADYFAAQTLSFATDEDMLSFTAEAMERSKYNFNVSVKATDRLLTLITLSDGTDTSRLIIVCRMLRDGESDGYLEADTAQP